MKSVLWGVGGRKGCLTVEAVLGQNGGLKCKWRYFGREKGCLRRKGMFVRCNCLFVL